MELLFTLPADWVTPPALARAGPDETATILRWGCDLFEHGAVLRSQCEEAEQRRLREAERRRLREESEHQQQQLLAEHRDALSQLRDGYERRLQQSAEALQRLRDEFAAAREAFSTAAASTGAELNRLVAVAVAPWADRETQARAEAAAREERARAEAEAREERLRAEAEAREERLRADLERSRADLERLRAEAASDLERSRADLERLRAEASADLERLRTDTAPALGEQLATLSQRFDRVFSAQAPSSDKGRMGEATLGALLQRLFPTAEYEDCSSTPGQGDAVLTLWRGSAPAMPPVPPRRIRIMIESKNVTAVRASDVTKFTRDCANRTQDCDAALFAALTAETIPHRGTCSFDSVDNKFPVLWLGGVLANPERLQLGVEALVYAVLARPPPEAEPTTEEPEDTLADVREAVGLAFGVLARQQARVHRLRESAAAVLAALADFEGETSIATAAIGALWANRPGLRPADVGAQGLSGGVGAHSLGAQIDPVASAALRVRDFIDREGRDPKRDEATSACGVPDSVLRKCGGIRVLIEQAKKIIR